MTGLIQRNGWMGVGFFFILLSAFLQWNSGIIPLDGPHDSLNYLHMAECILRNEWLGDYNQMTLIRSPVYSMFLAVNGAMGWALQRMQSIAYLLSIGLLAIALKTIDVAGWRIAAVCMLCSFHFAAWIPCRFVASEGLYTPVFTMLLAGMIGFAGSGNRSGWQAGFWLVVLSVSAALAWRMRDESIWMIPVGIIFGVCLLWKTNFDKIRQNIDHERQIGSFRHPIRLIRDKGWKQWGFRMAGIGLPCLCIVVLTGWIQHQNLRYYGMPVVTELAEPGFRSAFQWLTKLDAESHHPYVPVTQKAMSKAFEISSNFRLLQPYLSQEVNGAGWSRFGCDYMGICDELAGGWTVWAIRDAAASVGIHGSAEQAARFYRSISEDIETGCRNGAIRCSSNPTGNMLAPPLKWMDLLRILKSGVRVMWMTIWLGDLPETCHHLEDIKPSPELVDRYESIAGTPNKPKRVFFIQYGGMILWMFRVIHTIGGLWLLVACVAGGMRWMKKPFTVSPHRDERKKWVMGLLVTIAISRLAVVSYLDAMSFWAQLRYMLVIYPAWITLICLAVHLPSFPRLSIPYPRLPNLTKSPPA